MSAPMFGVGHRSGAPPLATTMQAATVLIVDTNIRCRGVNRERPCGRLLAERAGRPHTHVCPRCGFRNDSDDLSR